MCTVFPRIEAGVSISFVGFLTRPLNEAGLYSEEAFIRGNTVYTLYIMHRNDTGQYIRDQTSIISLLVGLILQPLPHTYNIPATVSGVVV